MSEELVSFLAAPHSSLITHHSLLVPVSDPASRQIVRRHLNAYAVTDQDANSVFAHLAGNRGQHDVLGIVELYFKERVGLLVNDSALRRNQVVSCQEVLLWKSFKFQVSSFKFLGTALQASRCPRRARSLET
jgi:hypothetical protein